MNITALPWGNRIDIKQESNLVKAKELFDTGEYNLSFTPLTEIEDDLFLKEFVKYFKNISDFSFSAFGDGVTYDFLYEMPMLKSLHLKIMYPIDFRGLTQLDTLSIWWNKKMISNFSSLENLESLHITEFDEKDLTKLSGLKNLKSLSFATAKIKSLKGIETLTNLEQLSLGGVRSLTDISAITALERLERLECNICWKLKDFSVIAQLQQLKKLQLMDCKNLENIQFVKNMPNLKKLVTAGTTIINDYDTTPAEHVPVFFGSQNAKYNKQYPEKELHTSLKEL